MKVPRFMLAALALLLVLIVALWWQPDLEQSSEPETDRTPAGEESGPVGFADYAPSSAAPDAPVNQLPGPAEDAIPGEYTVAFQSETALQQFLVDAQSAGVKVLGVIPELLTVRLAASASRLQSLLKEDMAVDHNFAVRAPSIPDPDFWQSADLRAFNDDVMQFLGAPSAMDRLSWGDGVTIAILDTGWSGHRAVAQDRVRVIDLLEAPQVGQFSGHGTAVVGLVASNDPFAPGISPSSDILAVQVLDGVGQGDAFTLAQGILAAVSAGADVINMSLGSYGNSPVLRQAIDYAYERGVVLVASSGNDGQGRVTYPAAYDSVLGVAAVDAEGNRAPFSNFGAGIDLAAPGYHLHALWEGDGYIYFDGTSASAPLVAGMAARILQSGAANSPAEVAELIRAQANETGLPGDDSQYGAGILNVQRIEDIGKTGIHDFALADLYPALEQSDGGSFPLYATVENRGTDYLPSATLELSINGTPYYYRFTGLVPGAVDSVQIPISLLKLDMGERYTISAKAVLPERLTDARPSNDEANITLSREAPEE